MPHQHDAGRGWCVLGGPWRGLGGSWTVFLSRQCTLCALKVGPRQANVGGWSNSNSHCLRLFKCQSLEAQILFTISCGKYQSLVRLIFMELWNFCKSRVISLRARKASKVHYGVIFFAGETTIAIAKRVSSSRNT